MALRERSPAEDLRRAVTGRPSLRRQARNIEGARLDGIVGELSAKIDQNRFRSLYRQRLVEALSLEQQAVPLRARDALTEQLRTNPQDPRADEARRTLEMAPKRGSAADRADPRSWSSAARRRFSPGLFRK